MTEREEKKAQFVQNKRGGNTWLIVLSLAVCVLALGGWFLSSKGQGGSSSRPSVSDGKILLPLAQVSDGKAHFYSHQGGSGEIKFFVVKSADGRVRTAFDTCDVCYKAKKGYRQDGDQMICNNCDQKFAVNKVGDISGGCNPAPLASTIVGDRLEISTADLEKGAWYFK